MRMSSPASLDRWYTWVSCTIDADHYALHVPLGGVFETRFSGRTSGPGSSDITHLAIPPLLCILPIHPYEMFARSIARSTSTLAQRGFSTSVRSNRSVAVLGAAGGIGQPMSLLLKADPLITSLRLYDIRGAPGVAADISHVNTASDVKGFEQAE